MKKRIPYIILSVIFIILCIIIVLVFAKNQFIRGFVGDAVIVMFLYSFVKSFIEIKPLPLSVGITIFAYLIEFSQYIKIVPLLGFQENLFTRIVFGSVFDPLDLLAYTLGGFLIYLLDNFLSSKIKSSLNH